MKYLPQLALNFDPPHLSLPSSWITSVSHLRPASKEFWKQDESMAPRLSRFLDGSREAAALPGFSNSPLFPACNFFTHSSLEIRRKLLQNCPVQWHHKQLSWVPHWGVHIPWSNFTSLFTGCKNTWHVSGVLASDWAAEYSWDGTQVKSQALVLSQI
jgi:hypothetical protein